MIDSYLKPTNEESDTDINERTFEECETGFVVKKDDHKCTNNKSHARNCGVRYLVNNIYANTRDAKRCQREQSDQFPLLLLTSKNPEGQVRTIEVIVRDECIELFIRDNDGALVELDEYEKGTKTLKESWCCDFPYCESVCACKDAISLTGSEIDRLLCI